MENESPWIIPPEPRNKTKPPKPHADHLLSMFEQFISFMMVEKEALPRTIASYRYCFADFLRFAQSKRKTLVLISDFSTELVRAYQYHLSDRHLSSNTTRSRLSVLAAFAKWALRHDKLDKNPLDQITRPPRRTKLPDTLRWDAVMRLIDRCEGPRDKALLALMAYGALRRSEVVALDVGDFDSHFGLSARFGPS